MSKINFDKDSLIFECPHCNEGIMVKKSEINCKIFRHGIFKKNFKQMGPHTKKDLCDKYANENLIYGCGKPFRIITNINNPELMKIEICGYI